MKIILDAMGSDTYPDPEVNAALEAYRQYGDKVTLVGDVKRLKPLLTGLAGENPPVDIVHAPKILEATDKPSEMARDKETSMNVGLSLVKSGQGDAFITAGNTGGAMATALFTLGRIRGVKRPALSGIFPVQDGRCVVLDIGANAECRPEYLVQFAILGSVYAQKVLGIENPRVGLLSNGEEANKGNDLVKETFPLLRESSVNFVGNIEGKELYGGQVDVAVMDGFTGNVLLKSSEAVAKLLVDLLRQELMASTRTKIGALLAKPAFGALRKLLDPADVGAVPLLGIDGLAFVAHGRSDDKAMFAAIRAARNAVDADLLEALRLAISSQLSR